MTSEPAIPGEGCGTRKAMNRVRKPVSIRGGHQPEDIAHRHRQGRSRRAAFDLGAAAEVLLAMGRIDMGRKANREHRPRDR